jgi:hypothetical protein
VGRRAEKKPPEAKRTEVVNWLKVNQPVARACSEAKRDMAKKHAKKKSASHKRKQSKVAASIPQAILEVERIVAHKLSETEEVLYRVRWKNCEAAEDGWRTREELAGHEEAVREYEEREGERKTVRFGEEVKWKRVNAAGNSVVEMRGLNDEVGMVAARG